MYPQELVAPMKADLTEIGFKELTTAAEVDEVLQNQSGTTFLVFNSVCGCAAGAARPGVKLAIKTSSKLPDRLVTAFAGVDREAVERARQYTLPYPPSSPSMALFKDGKLVHFIERHQIEGNSAETISEHLKKVFEHYC
ncbi:MAG: BrxA/BrxB family bacilliredoxin [Chitinophagales bacterium]|nr:BrxA/BrxB family bacilliredoxin [Chitinophagales bacterium]MDW8273794.1 BrxA/BrxB family bacilliredoxin [Chitinophagales bacterium]